MQPEAPRARDASFDILKGIGIVGVIVLHASNWSMRNLTMTGSNTWSALFVANRFMNIGVPLFLMVSAVLLARSQSKAKGGWGRFYGRRLQGLLWPYIIWTVVYWLVRVYVSKPDDFWLDWQTRSIDLLLGKASFHLYFMSVLLQFVVVFPLLFLFLRKVRIGFWPTVIIACGVQELVMVGQKYLRFPFPGSIFLWYLVPLVIGVWLGLHWEEWPALWRRWRLPFFIAFIATMMWFYSINLLALMREPFTSDSHKWSHTFFTLCGSLLLFGLSLGFRDAQNWLSRLFNEIGLNSLQLYLIHPLLLSLMVEPRILSQLKRLPYSPAWIVAILVVGSYLIGRVFGLLRLDGVFFGKSRVPKANVASAGGNLRA